MYPRITINAGQFKHHNFSKWMQSKAALWGWYMTWHYTRNWLRIQLNLPVYPEVGSGQMSLWCGAPDHKSPISGPRCFACEAAEPVYSRPPPPERMSMCNPPPPPRPTPHPPPLTPHHPTTTPPPPPTTTTHHHHPPTPHHPPHP